MEIIRRSKGYTQAELGSAVGVSQRTIAAYESGARHPSPAVFVRLMKVLDLTIMDAWALFYGDDDSGDGEQRDV